MACSGASPRRRGWCEDVPRTGVRHSGQLPPRRSSGIAPGIQARSYDGCRRFAARPAQECGPAIMHSRLTRYILLALALGVAFGWAANAVIDDGSETSAERLRLIAEDLSIVTTLFLRLVRMIIAPLVFSTLVAGVAHMGDIAAMGRVALRSAIWFMVASLVSLTLGLALVTILRPGVGLHLLVGSGNLAASISQPRSDLRISSRDWSHSPWWRRWPATRSCPS